MVSKLVIFLFAIVVIGFVTAEDYESEEGGDGGEGGEGGEGGGGYHDSGDGGYHSGGDYHDGEAEGEGEGDGEQTEEESRDVPTIVRIMRPLQRQRRSLNSEDSKRVLSRVRRGGYGRVGPVYTYQKTDYHGNFKWGVRHNVGRQYGHGK